MVLGYLENKKVSEDMMKVLKSPQIEKYCTLTDNLLVTNYLEWVWLVKGEVVKQVKLCDRDELHPKKLKLLEENVKKTKDLIDNFLVRKVEPISRPETLAKTLARPAV